MDITFGYSMWALMGNKNNIFDTSSKLGSSHEKLELIIW